MIDRKLTDVNDAIDYLKSQVSIEKIVGEVVDLKKSGSDMLKGSCCFHEERTPSLAVSPSKGLYHCYGCKAGGDAVTFYKQYYKMNTIESIYKIAENYGVSMSEYERDLTQEEKEKDLLYRAAADVQKRLASQVDEAMDYLQSRGITQETAEKYGIGYSGGIEEVQGALSPYPSTIIESLGIENPRMWDNSIVYPQYDSGRRVVAFKCRPIVDVEAGQAQRGPKWLGSASKSLLYSEENLYGFHLARRNLQDGSLIVVEGQHDVLSMHQHGILNVSGSDGTNFGAAKIAMLKEHGVREIVLLYDGDQAGREASARIAREFSKETEITIKIATLKSSDPDEVLRSGRMLDLRRSLYLAVYGGQYLVDQLVAGIDLSTTTGKIDLIKQTRTIVGSVSMIQRVFLIEYIGKLVAIDKHTIEDVYREETARTERSLLYNLDGERIVLGAMIRDVDFRAEVYDAMRETDFYLPKHQYLYSMMLELDDQSMPVSVDTLSTQANNHGYQQVLDRGYYIRVLYDTMGEYHNLLEDLTDKAARRNLIRQSEKFGEQLKDLRLRTVISLEEHLDQSQKAMEKSSNELIDGEVGAHQFMDTLHNRMENPNQIVGIQLGDRWRNTTSVLNGIQNKKLITVAANQSVGKTTLLCNWLNEICINQKLPWVHFSLEMPAEEVITKIVGLRSGVNTQKIERGNLTAEEYAAVQRAALDYYNSGLIVIDHAYTMESISNSIRKMIRMKKVVGTSIDYIQLMTVERSKFRQRYEELGDISGILKNDIAKGMGIPVIILSQLSKAATEAQVAKAEHGAGSYKVAQDSDVYITLKEKSDEEIDQYGLEMGNLTMNTDKNRSGQADVLQNLLFQREIQRMTEV